MKVSIITATYNRAGTLKDTLESVLQQDYPNIEHIIVDGASEDDTMQVISAYKRPELIVHSSPDKGVFDALNKGLEMATGDVVGFLHSDDFFANKHVVSLVVNNMQTYGVDSVFGDVLFVDAKDVTKRKRYYSSKDFTLDKFRDTDMPAHPSFFTKLEFYKRFGNFNTKYTIAADLDLLIRFLNTERLSFRYIDELMVVMRTGGLSNASLRQRWVLNREAVEVCRANGVRTSWWLVLGKLLGKVPGFFSIGEDSRISSIEEKRTYTFRNDPVH
ncbi:MAG: glycosyltransferase involved in cell wall biosynthesis [Gammaproteobacteria bacterium]|jgi:glycosyltransferase involved in cell wall biosynthesis